MLEVAKPATIAITKRIIGATAAAAIGAAVWAFVDCVGLTRIGVLLFVSIPLLGVPWPSRANRR